MSTERPMNRPRWPGVVAALLTMICACSTVGQARSGCETEGTEDLEPGHVRTSISGQAGCPGPVFLTEVSNGASHLTFTSSGGTGDANLYVRRGAIPTTTAYDFVSTQPGNGESVTVNAPQAGAWYVRLVPATSFAGVSLGASYDVSETPIDDDSPEHDLNDDHDGEFTYYTVEVPADSVRMDVTTDGGTGNVDLYVAYNAPPTVNSPLRSTSARNKEGVVILSPQGGHWVIGLRANAAYAGVTLLVHLTPKGDCVAGDTTHCLLGGRFAVALTWKNQHAGGAIGVGHMKPDSDQSGLFWFFDPANTELVVKVLDGTPVNGKFWVFYGGLTDVEFDLQVVDTVTGQQRVYHHAPGTLLGLADTAAFPLP